MEMKITKLFLENRRADKELIDFFSQQKEKSIDGVDIIQLLISLDKLDWAGWIVVNLLTHEQCNSYIGFGRLLKFKECARLLNTSRAKGAYNAVASAKTFIDAYVATHPYHDVTKAARAVITDADVRKFRIKVLSYGIKLLSM